MSQQGTPSNIILGLADVSYGGTNLGHTIGPTTPTFTHEQAEINVDDYGSTPVDIYDIGTQVEVIVTLAEFTLANINAAFPNGELTSDRVKFGSQAGTKIVAQKLVFAALNAGDFNFTIYRAIPVGDLSFNYENLQRQMTVTFRGLIDTTRPNGDKLCRLGGPSS